MKPAKPYWLLIIALALIKFSLPFLLQSPAYELQRDEFLYFQQGQHLDIGYLENPPLLSWLATISGWFGGSELTVRFWPCVFGAGTVILTCLIVVEFGGNRFSQFLGGFAITTGAYLRMHSLFQPNVLDIFFWTLSIYFLIRLFNTNDDKFLLLAAISLALGIWSKYSIIFLIAALGIGILLTSHRKILAKTTLYKAAAVAVLFVLPNLWWQWYHRWPLVHHMQELQQTQLQFLNPMDFIKDQLLYLFPVLVIWVAGVIFLFRRKQWRFISWTYLFVILLLLLGRGKSYYSMGIYPVLIAAGAVAWENFTRSRSWVRFSLIGLVVFLALLFVPLLLPLWKPSTLAQFYKNYNIQKTGLLKWEDQRDHDLPQDFADMLGWKELTSKAEKFYRSLPDSTQQNSIVYCRNYGQAGSLKFYTTENSFRSKVISDNGSFLLWIPRDLQFKHLVFVGRRLPDKDDEVFQHFQSARIVDSVQNIYSRQFGDKIIFFENIDSAGLQIARKGLNEMKATFQR